MKKGYYLKTFLISSLKWVLIISRQIETNWPSSRNRINFLGLNLKFNKSKDERWPISESTINFFSSISQSPETVLNFLILSPRALSMDMAYLQRSQRFQVSESVRRNWPNFIVAQISANKFELIHCNIGNTKSISINYFSPIELSLCTEQCVAISLLRGYCCRY